VFNSAYLSLINAKQRLQIFFGGSSSGKSFFLAQRTVTDILKGGRNYLICRNTANTIRKSTFNEITKVIESFGVNQLFTINKSDMLITCGNGYQIMFIGLDDTEKVKSTTPAHGVITDILIEEASEITYTKYKQLDKRLRGKSRHKKRMVLVLNPILKTHWIYKEFFGAWDDSKREYVTDDILIKKTTYKDNEHLEEDDIKALESETDKYYYEVYTLGNWGVLGSTIFKNYETRDLGKEIGAFDKIYIGCDFGFSKDPCAVVFSHYDKKKKTIYIYKEVYELELSNDNLVKILEKNEVNKTPIYCDCAEPKSIHELNKSGIYAYPVKKGKDSVNFGIKWLQQQKIIVDYQCVNTIKEFSSYRWKEDKDGNAMRTPVDKDNHIIDALRYAYENEMTEQETIIFT